uniref:Uncharacterized protein n=1 Tax=Anolis carolinensis TaxID=28377 RepID=R4GCF1_ANOCA
MGHSRLLFLFLPLQVLQSRRFWGSLLAEASGTLIFVWVVLGASSPAGPTEELPSPLQPALAAGMVAVSLAHCFGEISGAQVNPALTMAFLCTRKLDVLHAASYITAQCLGAIIASGIFYLILPTTAIGHLVTKVSSEGNAGQALGMEVFSTFQLALTIFAVENHRRHETGEPGILAIGFSVVAGALTAGAFSGGSMNPARSLGPAVVTGIWEHHWLHPSVNVGQAILVEIFLTLQFVLCIFATYDERRNHRMGSVALAVGLSLTLGHLFGMHYTGAGMNPARSFAPAIITRNFVNHWVYWVGPVIGGVLGGFLYDFILCPRMRGISERLSILKGEHQLETNAPPEPPGEPIELTTQAL